MIKNFLIILLIDIIGYYGQLKFLNFSSLGALTFCSIFTTFYFIGLFFFENCKQDHSILSPNDNISHPTPALKNMIYLFIVVIFSLFSTILTQKTNQQSIDLSLYKIQPIQVIQLKDSTRVLGKHQVLTISNKDYVDKNDLKLCYTTSKTGINRIKFSNWYICELITR